MPNGSQVAEIRFLPFAEKIIAKLNLSTLSLTIAGQVNRTISNQVSSFV